MSVENRIGGQNGSKIAPENAPSISLVEELKEKREPSLGERNPLITFPRLNNPEALTALKLVTEKTIEGKGGLKPIYMESGLVWDEYEKEELPRLFIKFETNSLTEQQVEMLEKVVKITYGPSSRTRRNSQGEMIPPSRYPLFEQAKTGSKPNKREKISGSLLGWYMGNNPAAISDTHQGLFVYKDLGDPGMAKYFSNKNPKEWFTNENLSNPFGKQLKMKYLIEIRAKDSYQTDIVKLAIQVSNILGKGEIINDSELLYEVYNRLNRLGLKKADKSNIYGLDEHIERIERVLFEPLANLHLSHGIGLNPGSVLLVGVPGSGKTLIAEYFLQKDTGVFLVPTDPLILANDLAAPLDKKTLLPRISQVFKDTGRPIVLQLDDIDGIAQDEQAINSTLINLMAGVRASGFYVLASTNHPERINQQLLQPERFAHLIYFGLPDTSVRRGILEVHANRVSRELGRKLFNSEEERDAILRIIADKTEGYTSRYLADICTGAKTFYLHSLTQRLKQTSGLTEENIVEPFHYDDWIKGLLEADRRYDKKALTKWDSQINDFIANHDKTTGFISTSSRHQKEQELRKAIEVEVARISDKSQINK